MLNLKGSSAKVDYLRQIMIKKTTTEMHGAEAEGEMPWCYLDWTIGRVLETHPSPHSELFNQKPIWSRYLNTWIVFIQLRERLIFFFFNQYSHAPVYTELLVSIIVPPVHTYSKISHPNDILMYSKRWWNKIHNPHSQKCIFKFRQIWGFSSLV